MGKIHIRSLQSEKLPMEKVELVNEGEKGPRSLKSKVERDIKDMKSGMMTYNSLSTPII